MVYQQPSAKLAKISWKTDGKAFISIILISFNVRNTLRDLVSFVQFKEREKHVRRSVIFSKFADWSGNRWQMQNFKNLRPRNWKDPHSEPWFYFFRRLLKTVVEIIFHWTLLSSVFYRLVINLINTVILANQGRRNSQPNQRRN